MEPVQEAILEDEDEVEILSDWPEAPVPSPPPPAVEEVEARPLVKLAEGFTAEHPKGVCIYFFYLTNDTKTTISHIFSKIP